MQKLKVPVALWCDLRAALSELACKGLIEETLLAQVKAVDIPDTSATAEERRLKIVELASDLSYVDNDGQVEVDEDAIISESTDNGCYVEAWVWLPFEGTEFDKEPKPPEEDDL